MCERGERRDRSSPIPAFARKCSSAQRGRRTSRQPRLGHSEGPQSCNLIGRQRRRNLPRRPIRSLRASKIRRPFIYFTFIILSLHSASSIVKYLLIFGLIFDKTTSRLVRPITTVKNLFVLTRVSITAQLTFCLVGLDLAAFVTSKLSTDLLV